MRLHFRSLSFALLSMSLLASCSDPTSAGGRRAIGIVEWVSGAQLALADAGVRATSGADVSPVIHAPDEVQAGVPFEAVITTIGPNLCWRADGATSEVKGNLAVVVPYDFTTQSENTMCADALAQLSRKVAITFSTPGEATLRVQGRKVIGGDHKSATSTTVEKKITVR